MKRVMILAVMLAAMAGCSSKSTELPVVAPTTTSTAVTTTTSTSTSTTTGAPTTTAFTEQVLYDQKAQGSLSSPTINIPTTAWQLGWSYSCAPDRGDFIVNFYDATTNEPLPDGVNQLDVRGTATDVFHSGPRAVYFKVISGCGYHIRILTAPGV